MADFSPSISQERERLKIELAQGELKAQLRGQGQAFGAGLYCPTEARERHQQRLATIKALCASVTALAQAV